MITNDVRDYIHLFVRIADVICNHPVQRELAKHCSCWFICPVTGSVGSESQPSCQ